MDDPSDESAAPLARPDRAKRQLVPPADLQRPWEAADRSAEEFRFDMVAG